MRAVGGLIALAAVAVSVPAPAAPVASLGSAADTVHMEGAAFSGVAHDGESLLLTNLADGRLYRWSTEGGFAAFGPPLPHGLDVIGDPTGPYDLARVGDSYVLAQGWTPVGEDPGPNDHAIIAVDDTSVLRVLSADFWNPFRFVVADETLYVIDAARNSVEELTLAGERTTIHAFPRLEQAEETLRALSPTEFANDRSYEFDAVPTGIALRDGRVYVSLFAGFPYLPGAGKIVSLALSGERPDLRVERDGLNAPVDVAFGADGRMLVLEHGRYDQANGFEPKTGRLISFDGDGKAPRLLLDRLTRPVSVLVLDGTTTVVCGLDGNLVFLTESISPQPPVQKEPQ